MLGLDITFKDNDVVDVAGNLYVKNQVALKRLLSELKRAGYQIDNLRKSKDRKKRGTSAEQMKKNGWSLWFAKLPDLRFGICGSCDKLINVTGIQTHEHKCEKCGAVTYYEMVNGSTIRFVFNNDEERGIFSPQLQMKVHHWDVERAFLFLYPEFLKGGLSVVTGEKAQAYLDRNKDKWAYKLIDDQKLIAILYPLEWNRDTARIEPYETWGHQWNHKIVKVWKGKQYEEYDCLPVPETISIYESWHWAPLPVTPTLHSRILRACGQTDDKGWHYQDGRPWFTSGHWIEMAKFVRHFTQLNADAFDHAWPSFRSSGPGGIDDLAHFCHKDAVARNDPNIGNVLIALGKGLEGQSLTKQEIQSAKDGLADPLVKKLFGRD